MKIAPVVFALISIGLCLATYAQDRPSQGSKSPSHGTKSRESPTRVNQPTPQHQNSVRHPGSITDQQPIYFTACRSCTGTSQTVALPIKDSTYEDVEADSGLSPTECLGNIKAICESGSYRHFATARCGN